MSLRYNFPIQLLLLLSTILLSSVCETHLEAEEEEGEGENDVLVPSEFA